MTGETKRDAVPAIGRDPLHGLVRLYHTATAAFDATSPADTVAHEAAAAAHIASVEAIANTRQVATTFEGAMAALRLANSELEAFADSEMVEPLVRGATAYFETQPVEKSNNGDNTP